MRADETVVLFTENSSYILTCILGTAFQLTQGCYGASHPKLSTCIIHKSFVL
jgi:hypothetical protein